MFRKDHRCGEMGPAIKQEMLRTESSGRNTFIKALLMAHTVLPASIFPENFS